MYLLCSFPCRTPGTRRRFSSNFSVLMAETPFQPDTKSAETVGRRTVRANRCNGHHGGHGQISYHNRLPPCERALARLLRCPRLPFLPRDPRSAAATTGRALAGAADHGLVRMSRLNRRVNPARFKGYLTPPASQGRKSGPCTRDAGVHGISVRPRRSFVDPSSSA